MAEIADRHGKARLYLEDLSPGQRFTGGTTHLMDEAQITRFAAEFDPQPFHLDPGAARSTLFGGLVASGWHTAAVTMRLLVDSGFTLAGGIVGLGGEIQWPQPTRPGDELRVEIEVIAITPSRSRADRGTVTMRCDTKNQRVETVQTLTARLVVPRRV